MVDYAFVGELDDTGITDALKRIDTEMVTLGNRMNDLFEPLSTVKSSFAGIEQAGKSAISAIRTETDLLKQDLKGLGTELSGVSVKADGTPIQPSSSGTVGDNQSGVNESISRTETALSAARKEADRLIKAMDDLGDTDDDVERLLRTIEGFDSVDNDVKKVVTEINKLEKALKDAGTDNSKIDQIKKDADQQLKILKKIVSEKKKLATDELKLQARIEKARLRGQKIAEKQLRSQIKMFPKVHNKLVELADKYDGLRVEINGVYGASKNYEKEVIKAIRSEKQLINVVDRLTDNYGEFNLELNRTNFKKSSNEMGKLKNSMSSMSQTMRNLGLLFIFREIGQQALQMARQVGSAFVQMTKESGRIANQFKANKISFENLLGDPEKAGRLFNTTRELSIKLGVDTSGITNAFLPLVDDIKELEGLAINVQELLTLSSIGGDPKDQASAIRAVSDLIVEGNPISARKMFELVAPEIDKILAARATGGIAAASQALHEVLQARGIDYEEFLKQSDTQLNIFRELGRGFKGFYGEAINQGFADFLITLNELLKKNKDELSLISKALGQFFVSLTSDASGNFFDKLKEIDFEDVKEKLNNVANSINDTIVMVEALGNTFSSLGDVFFTERSILEWLEDIQISTIQMGVLIDKYWNLPLMKVGGLISGIAEKIGGSNLSLDEILTRKKTGIESWFEDEVTTAIDLIDDLTKEIDIFNGVEIDSEKFSELDLIEFRKDAITDEIEETNKEMIEAKKEIDAAILDLEEEFDKEQLEMKRDHLQNLLDLELDFSRERAAKLRKHLDDHAKFELGMTEDNEDLALGHVRKLEDIDRKRITDEIKAKKTADKKKLDAEEEYQQKLEKMKRDFLFSANEAIRQNDAVGFLQLQRKYQFDQKEAQIAKEQKEKDADSTSNEEIQKIKDNAAEQVREEGIGHDRSLKDLDTALKRKFDAMEAAWLIELREAKIKEDDRRADLDASWALEIEAFERHKIERMDQIKQSKEEEYDIVRDGHNTLLELDKESYALRQKEAAIFQKQMLELLRVDPVDALKGQAGQRTTTSSITSPSSSVSSERGTASRIQGMRDAALQIARDRGYEDAYKDQIEYFFNNNDSTGLIELIDRLNDLQRREFGGPVKKGQGYIVGEAGPEIMIPDQNGTIIPNNFASMLNKQSASTQATFPAFNSGGNVDNSKNIQVDLSMIDPSTLSSGQLAIIQSVVRQTILEATLNV